MTADIPTLMQFLTEGDWLGFLQAVYTAAFGNGELFYAFLILLFMSPLYIRTRSLALMSILWLLIGAFIIAEAPLVAGLGMIFCGLGLTGIVVRIWSGRES